MLPGDKIFQAMEIEQAFMRPVIVHGFGAGANRIPTATGLLWMATDGGGALRNLSVATSVDAFKLPASHWIAPSLQGGTEPLTEQQMLLLLGQ